MKTKGTFGAQFNRRNQKVSERAEEYASELKRLYDKVYFNGGSETGQEDLPRRFLAGFMMIKPGFRLSMSRNQIQLMRLSLVL